MRRLSLVDKLNLDLAVRDIESVFDDYIRWLAWNRPGPGTNGWRARLRRRVDGLQALDDAAELLDEMLTALDRHELGTT